MTTYTDETIGFYAASAREISAYEASEARDAYASEEFGSDWRERDSERFVPENDVEGGEPDLEDVLFDDWHERWMASQVW